MNKKCKNCGCETEQREFSPAELLEEGVHHVNMRIETLIEIDDMIKELQKKLSRCQ